MEGNLSYFKNELAVIGNKEMAHLVEACLLCAPDYFYEIPASSTGLNHPAWSHRKHGLVYHTKTAVALAIDIARREDLEDESRDYLIAALLLHDTLKYGLDGPGSDAARKEFDFAMHPYAPRHYFKFRAHLINREMADKIFYIIEHHMGRWSHLPFSCCTELAKLAHEADFLASRSYCPCLAVNESGQVGRVLLPDSKEDMV